MEIKPKLVLTCCMFLIFLACSNSKNENTNYEPTSKPNAEIISEEESVASASLQKAEEASPNGFISSSAAVENGKDLPVNLYE